MMTEEEYYRTLPRKKVAASVLLFNANGEVLVVNPSYRNHWLLVGGMVDADEAPRLAALRETTEEIGISLDRIQLVCVDHWTAENTISGDALHFIFNGGLLSDEQIASIKLQDSELTEYKFVHVDMVSQYLSEIGAKRFPEIMRAIEKGAVIYLENAKPAY